MDDAGSPANACAFDAVSPYSEPFAWIGFRLAEEGNGVGLIEHVHVVDHPEGGVIQPRRGIWIHPAGVPYRGEATESGYPFLFLLQKILRQAR